MTGLVSGGDDPRALIWRVHALNNKPVPVKAFHGSTSNIFCTIFSPDNRHILSCGNDAMIRRHDVEHGASASVTAATARGGRGGGGRGAGRSTEFYDEHAAAVYRVAYVEDGTSSVFLSAGGDGRVLLWDTRAGRAPRSYCVQTGPSKVSLHT